MGNLSCSPRRRAVECIHPGAVCANHATRWLGWHAYFLVASAVRVSSHTRDIQPLAKTLVNDSQSAWCFGMDFVHRMHVCVSACQVCVRVCVSVCACPFDFGPTLPCLSPPSPNSHADRSANNSLCYMLLLACLQELLADGLDLPCLAFASGSRVCRGAACRARCAGSSKDARH